MVKIGLIGTGFAERVQLPAFRHVESASVVAVSSGHRSSAERAAAAFEIPRVCGSWEELVALDEVDLVVISSPPHTHAPATIAAARAGKHVLCEKPLALDADEAREMVEAVEEAGVLALVDHELRFNPNRLRAKALVDEGAIGDLRHLTFFYRSGFGLQKEFNWWYERTKGGGLLGAIGSHVIDAVRWWAGEIDDVSCRLATFLPERPDSETGEMRKVDVDDFARFTLGLRSGAVVEASLSSVSPGPPTAWTEIVGSEGRLLLDEESLTLTLFRGHDARDETVADELRGLEGLGHPLWPPAFLRFAREIVSAIEARRREVAGAATLADGLATQRVLDAAYRSNDSGARETVETDPNSQR
jgi:predicted dehydrogenase